MPIVGIGDRLGDPAGERLGDLLEHDREGAGLGDGARVGEHALGVGAAALHAVAAGDVDRLRRQPDVGHHRDRRARRQEARSSRPCVAPPSSLTAAQPVSAITRAALRNACSGPAS